MYSAEGSATSPNRVPKVAPNVNTNVNTNPEMGPEMGQESVPESVPSSKPGAAPVMSSIPAPSVASFRYNGITSPKVFPSRDDEKEMRRVLNARVADRIMSLFRKIDEVD